MKERRKTATSNFGVGGREAMMDGAWKRASGDDWPLPQTRWTALHLAHVRQADEGCDFDVLERGAPTPEPEIH